MNSDRSAEPALTEMAPAALSGEAAPSTRDATATAPFHPSTAAEPTSAPLGRPLRYRVLRLHAKGGLGSVSVAEDLEFGREVALKEIQTPFADDAHARMRFIREAEVTGRLEHPGIVPVYGQGVDRDGRPYYAMRFIRGRDLRQALQQQHAAGKPNLRELLKPFIDACNAVAFAHSKGVIHRDLKPANIMLGGYGETLVVDWGLAKVVGQGPLAEQHQHNLSHEKANDSETRVGDAFGTPAYMSPEQAAGKWDEVDARSDIYSLGATFFELLAGRRPYTGTSQEVLAQAQRGQPIELVAAPKPLAAVCRKAMAREPADRYATALELAADVERWLADEPVSAYREPMAARLGRWRRGHPRLVTGAMVLVLVATTGLAAGVALLDRKQRETDRARTDAENNYQRAEGERRRSEDLLTRAETSYKLARTGLDKAMQLRDDPRLKSGPLQVLQRRFAEAEADFFRQFLQLRGDEPAFQAERGTAHARLGLVAMELSGPEQALPHFREAVRIFRTLAKGNPGAAAYEEGLATSLNSLAEMLLQTNRPDQAEPAFREAIDRFDALAGNPQTKNYEASAARCRFNLGRLCQFAGRDPEAETLFKNALAVQERLANEHLDVASGYKDLGLTLAGLAVLFQRQERSAEAATLFARAVASAERLDTLQPDLPESHDQLAVSLLNLAAFHSDSGQAVEAETVLVRALGVLTTLNERYPAVPEYRYKLAVLLQNLGAIHADNRRFSEAETCYRKAVEMLEPLIEKNPTVTSLATHLGRIEANLGKIYRDQEMWDEALAWYDRAIATLEGVLGRGDRAQETRDQTSTAHEGRAIVLGRLRRHALAIEAWETAIGYAVKEDQRPWLRIRRAVALARAGDHATAAAEADELAREVNGPWEPLLELARAFSLAAHAVVGEPAAEQYGRRAVLVLYKAQKAGYFLSPIVVKQLEESQDFEAVHGRDDYQELVRELKKS